MSQQNKQRRAFCNWCGAPYPTTDVRQVTCSVAHSNKLKGWRQRFANQSAGRPRS